MRGGSVIDGTEVLAVFISRRTSLTIGDVILIFNVLIFGVAAYVFTIEISLYAMLTYLAASKTVDFVVSGIEEYVGVTIISDYNEEFLESKYEEMLTFNAKNDFLRDRLHLELFSYYGMNDKDGLVRLKLSYDISDNLIVLLGSDVFFGTTGDFGQFYDNDLVYSKVKYLF